MTYIDGEGRGAEVVPLEVFRFERLLEKRLLEHLASEDFDASVSVTFKSLGEGYDLPDDFEMSEEFLEGILENIAETLNIHSPGFDDPSAQTPLSDCDYLVARMRCHCCRRVSGDDNSTQCETFFRETPDGSWLRVGDHVGTPITEDRLDYYTINAPTSETLHIIEGWECSNCQHVNWAEVVIESGVIRSIWSVDLNVDSLERAILVSSECVEIASRITNTPPWTLTGPEVIKILTDNL